MPGMNGKGPQGAGSQTGRGLGYCNNSTSDVPFRGKMNRMCKGFSYGRGFGFRRFNETTEITPEQQENILKQQKSYLEAELAAIDDQINKL